MPGSLTIGGVTNSYLYASDGTKLRVTRGTNVTDYVGNAIYENGVLKRILVDGGYIENGVYHFYLTDHLGNNRIVANQSGTVVQSTQYYPYGMSLADGTNPNAQPYKYNGKELDSDKGLNLYDYEVRYMDGALGRFTTMDPLAESRPEESPYTFCGGNPVNRMDPTGLHLVQKGDSVSWNNDAVSARTTPEGYTYLGQTANGTDASGNYVYYAQNGRTYDSAPLPEVTVTAEMPGHIKDMRAASYLNIYGGTEAFMSHPLTIGASIATGLLGMVEGVGAIASGAKSLFNVAKGLVRGARSAARGGTHLWPAASNGRTVINGIEYTKHALERMQPVGTAIDEAGKLASRGITPSVVENAIKHGAVSAGRTASEVARIYQNVKVITNQQGTRVITVYKLGN